MDIMREVDRVLKFFKRCGNRANNHFELPSDVHQEAIFYELLVELQNAFNEEKLHESQDIISKIESKTVTANDFNKLIQEATPESVRDRLRRRPAHQQNAVRSHQDSKGHSKLQLPTMASRIHPKRKRSNRTQMQHRGKLGHRHSARTQRRTMSKSVSEAVQFIQENIGKPLNHELLADIEDRIALQRVAIKLMSKPGINRDWLAGLCDTLDN